MHPVHQKAIKFIKSRNLISPGSRVLVAFSGGADSVFLLDFLRAFKKLFKIEIAALHLHHSIRGKEADEDAAFCRAFCAGTQTEFFSFRKKVPAYAKKRGLSLEEAAREIRYEVLEECARKNNFDLIATAHNLEDNSETMFLNLIKGSGLNGLTGIPVVRGNIIRPLLGISKNEIVSYLQIKKIPYRNDSTNDSVGYDRNFLRLIVLPQLRDRFNPNLDETLLKTAGNLSEYREYLETKVFAEIMERLFIQEKGRILIRTDRIEEPDLIIIGSVLRQLVSENFGITLSNERIKEILRLLSKQKGKSVELGGGISAIKEVGVVSIEKTPLRTKTEIIVKPGADIKVAGKKISVKFVDPAQVKITRSASEEFLGSGRKAAKMVIRNWHEGDKFAPIGMRGTKKVSDFLAGLKLKPAERMNQLVLEIDGEIAWIIGFRISEKFKIKKDSLYHYHLRVTDG